MQIYRDPDTDPALLSGKRIAVIGFGNQGRAQALNLLDGGHDVIVGLRPGSAKREAAVAEGLEVRTPAEAARDADFVVLLVPDELMGTVYGAAEATLKPGAALVFAHGLAIRFGLVAPREDLDVVLVAPKGPGSALRTNYVAGGGMAGLFAVHADATGRASALALAYGGAIGLGRIGMLESSFAQEAEADLFNEAAVIWGAVPEVILAGYEMLVEAGYPAELAAMECAGELKLLADLVAARGIAGMREAISNTAEYLSQAGGPRVIDAGVKARMAGLLAEVRSGALVAAMLEDAARGSPALAAARTRFAEHPLEATRRALLALES